ncbi:MAG: FKBP-type peptidyl-prolyl cis-trans isomerase [Nitrospirales bacterium]
MLPIRYLLIGAIGLVLFLVVGFFLSPLQAFLTENAVQDGAKVTVRFQITPEDSPTTTYSDIEQFVQGQHAIPFGIEQQVAGMRPGEVRTFALSAEEGFGPYDETKIQTVPPAELPLDAREGDTIANPAGTTARIVRILPEKALLDLNHPLAGKPLLVSLQIVTVENSDEEETLP